ncbi:hypothetical protein L6164_027055 [Bauhinia variegata]|uniref:Uncharacterized protein n=1 Tax=Bauhinia variegata TaxID=167791 RepID=A0ACB9LTI8_BAUVA|nr:hypothetical protein L6164_027055 [Bauhinia variegata]
MVGIESHRFLCQRSLFTHSETGERREGRREEQRDSQRNPSSFLGTKIPLSCCISFLRLFLLTDVTEDVWFYF